MTQNGRTRNPLHKARVKRHLTLEELAQLSGVSIGAISRLETEFTKRPHKLTRQALARALDVDAQVLFPRKAAKR